MSKHRSLTQAREDFLSYYLPLLPQFSTKSELSDYLTLRNPPVLLVSPLHKKELQSLWQEQGLSWKELPWFPYAISWPESVSFSSSLPGFSTGWLYSLHPSSLLPVIALDPKTDDSILDASAAPGGKTLAIANLLYPGPINIIANDASLPRYKQLRSVLTKFGYLSVATSHSPIQALRYKLTGQFTKILLDAPCSSEKHVFNSKTHLKLWSPSRITNLCHLQRLLIDALIPLLAPQGTLVYSTCALAPQENGQVVKLTLASHPELKSAPFTSRHPISPTEDPMFVAKLVKI